MSKNVYCMNNVLIRGILYNSIFPPKYKNIVYRIHKGKAQIKASRKFLHGPN